MLTTAKSLQLLDSSGLNISPVTDITSLYYEVESKKNINDTSIIARKYIYPNFPVGVNIDPSTYIDTFSTNSFTREGGPTLYDGVDLYKLVNQDQSDILVSHIETSIIPGTTLRQIDVSQYNLSNILYNYTPINLMDTSINNINSSIDRIDNSIGIINISIDNLQKILNASVDSLKNILDLANGGGLIPNNIYVINDYYYNENYGPDNSVGCMAIPSNDNFNGPDINASLYIYTKAISNRSLDNKIYNMETPIGKSLDVYGNYKIDDSSRLQITYLRDKWNNEAYFDFYNLKYQGNSCFQYDNVFESEYKNILYYNENGNIRNNSIKIDPFLSLQNNASIYYLSIYSYSNNDGNNCNLIFQNNNIGYNTIFDISSYLMGHQDATLNLNIIGNTIKNSTKFKAKFNNSFRIDESSNIENTIQNNVVMNDSSVNIALTDAEETFLKDSVIGNNNIVNISTGFSKLVMKSNNNITFSNTSGELNNVIIMSNCYGTINAANNIIIDNKPDNPTLNASSNSAYLYRQDIYAASFNSLN